MFVPGEGAHAGRVRARDIERMLPHRDPFLFVDGIDAVELPRGAEEPGMIRGVRDDRRRGRGVRRPLPGDPVYVVLLVEAGSG